MTPMSWSDTFPDEIGDRLRITINRTLRQVYDGNVRRYDPDDIGDNNMTFAVNLTHNLRHCLEQEVSEVEEIVVYRPQNSFFLRIADCADLHFYKAQPGASSIRDLKFDESDLKLTLRNENTVQLALDLGDGYFSSTKTLPHVVVAHFGDPIDGFGRAEVGSPYSTTAGSCDWIWHHHLEGDDGDAGYADRTLNPNPRTEPGFGLELRTPKTGFGESHGRGTESGPQ